MAMVDTEAGLEKQFFAVTQEMIAPLESIGITVADYRLYLTITARGSVKIIPVREADPSGEQNDWNRSKALAMLSAREKWVRLYADMENHAYRVFPAPVDRFPSPQWPPLKPARISKLAFRDKGRLLDSVEHPLFVKWSARDRDV